MSDHAAPRVVVIGAGAAGLSAAFAAGWRGARVQLVDPLGPGGQLQNAGAIETIPGLGPVNGPELVDRMVASFEGLAIDTVFGMVTGIDRNADGFAIATDTGDALAADVVIVASGSQPRPLGVPGETEFEHRGVSHCAACDGPLYRGRPVVVAGSGDAAADAALALAEAGASVTLVHRGRELRAAASLRGRIDALSDIERVPASEVAAIEGDDVVRSVVVRSLADGSERTVATSAVFTAGGIVVDTTAFGPQLARDGDGRLVVDVHLACSVPGVFAAGSVRQGSSDQLAGAIGDGTTAAVNALRWFAGELDVNVSAPVAPRDDRANGHRAFASYVDYFDALTDEGAGDGLPVVPPTDARIERMLTAAGLDADVELGPDGVVARDLMACAVAAGCRTDYAPVVLSAARSLLHDIDRRRHLLADSILAVVVNGPVRLQIDLNCSDGLFGPGWRANATIGRALRLFATGPLAIPVAAGFGDPGQYAFCFGEDEEKSPWTPLHVERGGDPDSSAVTVFPAAIYRQVMDRAHNDSGGIVDYITLFLRGRAAGTRLFGDQPLSLMVVVGQELRRLLAPDYDKARLRDELFARVTADDGTPFGPIAVDAPDDILVVAAGGVAFPTVWVLTTPSGPPATIAIEQLVSEGAA